MNQKKVTSDHSGHWGWPWLDTLIGTGSVILFCACLAFVGWYAWNLIQAAG